MTLLPLLTKDLSEFAATISRESTFEGRQQIRDEYQTYADTLRGVVDLAPVEMRPAVNNYLVHVSQVIARGATQKDIDEFKAKLEEFVTMEESLKARASEPISITVDAGVTGKKAVSTESQPLPQVSSILDQVEEVNPWLLASGVLLLLWLWRK